MNSLTLSENFNMLGVLNGPEKLVQHNPNSKGSYAKFSSITQNKNVCAPDPCLGMGAFPYFEAGLSTQQVRIFIWEFIMSNQIVPASVSFHGTEIITVQKDGVDYVALKPIVEALGLDWKNQHSKVTSSKRYGDITIPLETNGGYQDAICIPLSKLNGFLFSINPSKIPNEETRNKVIIYQEECFIALYKYWHEGQATRTDAEAKPLTEDDRKALLNDMYSHIERVRDMADNLTVIYRDINQSLNKIGNVAAILNSSEYKDRRLAVHKR